MFHICSHLRYILLQDFNSIYLDNPCGVSPSTFCANGGTCISSNTDPPRGACLCPEGFTGPYCNMTMQNDPCASNPCQGRGYCVLSVTNTSYSCICQTNYTGSQCERRKKLIFWNYWIYFSCLYIVSPCLSSPCLNEAACQAYWNTTNTWVICRCADTFTGTRCETSLLNPCGGLCMNGYRLIFVFLLNLNFDFFSSSSSRSPCINGVCICPPQYIGTFCGYS